MRARTLPAFRCRRDWLPAGQAIPLKLPILFQTAGVAGPLSRLCLYSLPRESTRKNGSVSTFATPAWGGICRKNFPARSDPRDPPTSSAVGPLCPCRRSSRRPAESAVEALEHLSPTLTRQSQALPDGGLILCDRPPFVAPPLASAPFEQLQVRRQRHFETPLVRSPGRRDWPLLMIANAILSDANTPASNSLRSRSHWLRWS